MGACAVSTNIGTTPLFLFCGLVPWTYFSNAVLSGSTSVTAYSGLVKHLYLPRKYMALTPCLSGLVSLAISGLLLMCLIGYHGLEVPARIVWLPVVLVLLLTSAVGVCFSVAALNVEYRDVGQVLPFGVQFWFFATPVAYPLGMRNSVLLDVLYGLNPLVGVTEGFRTCFLPSYPVNSVAIAASICSSFVGLIVGFVIFSHKERNFADVL